MAGTRKLRLSEAFVARLKPRTREYTVWDTRVAGLGVRVRPSGYRGYLFRHYALGRMQKITLGPVSSKAVNEARRECLEIAAQAQRDNRGTSVTKSCTETLHFCDFVTGQWRSDCYTRYRISTKIGVNSALRSQLLPAFGHRPLDALTREHINRWFDGYSVRSPGGANHALSVLRQILNHAIACGHIEKNPVRGVKRNRRTPLTRFLSKEEVRRLHLALDAYRDSKWTLAQQADVIRLLLLTGCRRGEIINLRWQEVEDNVLNLSDSKTGPRIVCLSLPAHGIIERQPRGHSEFVFPALRDPSRPMHRGIPLWYKVRKTVGIEDVRLHDLRHTFASHAVLQGVPLPVVSRLLGHSQVNMTLRYAHVANREIQAAAERIGSAIARLLAEPLQRQSR